MVTALSHDGLWKLDQVRAGWDGTFLNKGAIPNPGLAPAGVAQQRPNLDTCYPNGIGRMVRIPDDY